MTARRAGSSVLPLDEWSMASSSEGAGARAGNVCVAVVGDVGAMEIMGLMQGKFEGDSFIVMDAFLVLPVEGTEAKVSASTDAYEYMFEYSTINKQNALVSA